MSDDVLIQNSNSRSPRARRQCSTRALLGLCALLWPATACLNFPNPGNEGPKEDDTGDEGSTEAETGETEAESTSEDDGESTTSDSGDDSDTAEDTNQDSGKGVQLDWRHELLPGETVIPVQATVDREGNAVVLFSGLGMTPEDTPGGYVARYSPDGDELQRVALDADGASADELHGFKIVLSEGHGAYLLVAANRGDEQDLLLQHLDDRFAASETIELGVFEEPFDMALDEDGRPSVLTWQDRGDLKRQDYDHDLKLREIQEYVLNPLPKELSGAGCKVNQSGQAFVAYNHESDDEQMVRYAFFDDTGTLQWTDDYNTGESDKLFGVDIDGDGAAYLFIRTSSDSKAREAKVILLRMNPAGDVDWAKHIPTQPDGQKTEVFMRDGAVVNEAGLFVHSVHYWRTDGGSKSHGLLQIRHYDVEGNEVWHFGQRQELDPSDTTPGRIAVEPGEHIYVLTNALRDDVGQSSAFVSHYSRAP